MNNGKRLGVCPVCQQQDIPLTTYRGKTVLASHDNCGEPCQGNLNRPQATYPSTQETKKTQEDNEGADGYMVDGTDIRDFGNR